MKIVWAPNPLRTVVELDDADKRLLRERIRSERLLERVSSAFFAIDPDMRAHSEKAGRGQTMEQALAEVRTCLDLDYLLDGTEQHGKTFDGVIDEQLAWCVAELAAEHCGDCTCVPSSCLKCQAEGLLGIDTTKGLGKHEASKIGGFFKTTDSIDEVLRLLEEYRPTWNPSWRSEEEFEKHVPRWIEEGKRALEWLAAYKREHLDAWCLRSAKATAKP